MIEVQVREPLARAFQRVPNGPGEPPGEDRLVLGGVSWEQYVAIDEERGAEHSQPRLYFLNEQLEVMTTSRRHERIKDWITWLLLEFFNEADLEVFTHGQATLQEFGRAGAEPDGSWCLGAEKEIPDLVLEVALTSGGVDKLEIYRRFAVPEVWLWQNERLEIWTLRTDAGGYDGPARASRLLPALDLALLERCVALSTWREARRTFRDGIAPPRPH